MTTHEFQYYLSEFLARFLPGEVGAATNTIMSYRDTFTLLLRYCKVHEDITPEHMTCELLTRDLVERLGLPPVLLTPRPSERVLVEGC
jgi:integrase/recombinase XerD